MNVLPFHGEQIIRPDELEDQPPRAMYKAGGKTRETERDVAKRWVKNNIRIACIGPENQTKADPYMPLRVMGYDGVEYQTQLRNLKRGESPVRWSRWCCTLVTRAIGTRQRRSWKR